MRGRIAQVGSSVSEQDFVEPDRFVASLVEMPAIEIDRVASEIGSQHGCAADEVDAWRATIAIDRTLRDLKRSCQAAGWAHRAAEAVRLSAERAGLVTPSEVVTSVARSAAEVSRALVAGELVRAELGWLLRPWNEYVLAGNERTLLAIQSELAFTNSWSR